MSRIGIRPVLVPQGVKIAVQGLKLNVEGPKGKLAQDLSDRVVITQKDNQVVVTRKADDKQSKADHGLYRNLLNNMVIGVSSGFTRTLIVNGVGYKAEVQGKILILSLGYSTDYAVAIPDGVQVAVEKDKIAVSGIDKALVGKFSSEVRKLRPIEPYKGKGIRYSDEPVRKKVGKSGVK
jgi:large subunit ribosomal protein L6